MTRRNYNYKLHGLEPIRSLIFTNRLINHETLHYCFTHFIFRLDSDFDSLLTLMSEFYVQIGKRMRKLIRFVVIPRFSVDTVFFRDGYRSAPAESLPEKYRELVGDMDIAFRKLKGFRALGEVRLGLYFTGGDQGTRGLGLGLDVRMMGRGMGMEWIRHGIRVLWGCLGMRRILGRELKIGDLVGTFTKRCSWCGITAASGRWFAAIEGKSCTYSG